jgi:hypothetical protein
MGETVKDFEYDEVMKKIRFKKILLFYSERALQTVDLFEIQTIRLRKELLALEVQLSAMEPPTPAQRQKKKKTNPMDSSSTVGHA